MAKNNNITKFPGPKGGMHKKPVAKKAGSPVIMGDKNMPSDPQMTINVQNEEVEKLLRDYSAAHSGEVLNTLVNALVKTRILMPATVNDKNVPMPMMIKNKEGDIILPIYTSKDQIPTEPKSPAVLNVPFLVANDMALRENLKITGLVINPFTNNLIFKPELLKKIKEVEEMKKNGVTPPQVKQVKMTEPQYNAFERTRYERTFLPGKLFEDSDTFIDTLLDRKEEYVDELFEECYQQKRMYPFLPEDFAIMALNISENLLAVRLDMPARDIPMGGCHRVYIVRDSEKNAVRYFTIEKQANKKTALGEVASDGKHLDHGEAPVEGAELQTILDLL